MGGDVLGGLQICSILSDAQKNGHKTIANVTSIAASMASVIACACQELNLYEGAFIMCHLPWTMTMGNSKDLQKEIATLDQLKNSMVKFYKTKFNLDDSQIDEMLEKETWIDSDNYKEYGLNCNIIENAEPMRIAASINKKHFKNIPKRIMNMAEKNEETPIEEELKEEVIEETKEQNDDTTEEKVEEIVEEVVEEKTPEELKEEIKKLTERISELEAQLAECQKEQTKGEDDEETITKEEADKRVSGMQASMQKQVNDFKGQLQAKEEELTKAKAEITSLSQKLDETSKELSNTTSALNEKTQALDKLNANVNAHSEELPTMNEGLAKCASPAEKVAFLKSGKYVM